MIEDIKENTDVENTEHTVNSQEPLETVNVITPTIDTINQRKEEFYKTKIDLTHLKQDEKNNLYTLLKENLKHFQVH